MPERRPRPTVTAPTAQPLGYGLLSVASEQTRTDPHTRHGVQYEPTAGTDGGGHRTIDANGAPVGQLPSEAYDGAGEDGQLPLVETEPFQIVEGVRAKPVGITVQQLAERARARLQLNRGLRIEQGFYPQLQPEATVHPEVVASTALDPDVAVGLLEEWLAVNVGALGTIHTPRRGIGVLGKLVQDKGGRKLTALGTPVAFAAGMPNVAPDGTPAAAGVVWLYATGPVQVNGSGMDPMPEGGPGAAMTLAQNTAQVYATEVVSVGYEVGAIAVPVKYEVES